MQNPSVFSGMKYICCVLSKVAETFCQLWKSIERGVDPALGNWVKILALW